MRAEKGWQSGYEKSIYVLDYAVIYICEFGLVALFSLSRKSCITERNDVDLRVPANRRVVFLRKEAPTNKSVSGGEGKRKIDLMALVAVSSVINSTLVPLLSGEVNLLRNIHKEVSSIKAELESIMSFLKDADSSPKLKNERAENWVKQVRALAYEIEDVMDEYILHLAENRKRRGFIGFLRKLTRSITKLKPQHNIASQIQDIKQNICDIKERAERYGFSSLEHASSSKHKEKLHDDPRVASLFIEEDEVVGVESTRDELVHRLIIGESNRTVTSLVGMGGCGKTTLAKKVFDNRKVIEHFDCQAWLSVSQSYKMDDIFRKMMKQLCETRKECAPVGIDTMDQNSLIHMLREYFLQKRYLLVFDDVWSTEFWIIVKIALPKNDKGSRIIVTTRSEDVALFCKESPSDHICKVEPLIAEEAWKLFCMITFQHDFGGGCPTELEKVSRAIVRKCEGLPLAIVTIGALLSTKSKVMSEWQRFYNSLGSELERNPHLTNVTKIVMLSYHDLPYYLKPCFLYFGIIPEDFQISRGRLIRLWIAEGFIEGQKGKTLEEVAEEHLTELVQRSLVQVSEAKLDGRIKRCQVHDVVHEIILAKCEELCFCHVLREADPSWNNETRRWSMPMQNITNKNLETMSTNIKSKIRSIFLFSMDELPKKHLLGTLFVNFKLLKVLDLQGAPLDQLHEEVGNLLHLRYLSVKRTSVKIIPKSVRNLHNLQTLNLKDSHVLQIGILSRLCKLRHLIAASRFMVRGLTIQGGIGHLEELHTFWGLEANDDLIKELENLRQLRKLGIKNLKIEHGKVLCTAIEKMNHLHSLSVWAIGNDGILNLCSLSSPPESLRDLILRGHLETLPNWILRLDNLVSLTLYFSGLTDAHAIKDLQALPNLIKLDIFKGYDGEQFYFDVGGFPKLKLLYLRFLKRLNSIIIEEGGLPVLKELQIDNCPQLKEVPSGIRNLRQLKSLFIMDMPTEFLDRMQPDKGQDCWIVEHVPEVLIVFTDGGTRIHNVSTPQEFQDARESQRLNYDDPERGSGS
ncbi:disease resistance protein RPM1-like [Rhododendron vialii]|uniref:disease resistance protein RPM1-like n=1 Tax=Rhododendron vialii TaxID=182163 RepID=UPI00265DF917|nr:disease resistance protein RPM1-like [Rhododendron vialii]